MAKPKYKQYVMEMLEQNHDLFLAFKPIHDGYQTNRKQWSQQFHKEGQQLVDIARDWERRLCSGMEKGKNGMFSSKVAEKFWEEVKKQYPMIDRVGVKSNLD